MVSSVSISVKENFGCRPTPRSAGEERNSDKKTMGVGLTRLLAQQRKLSL